MIEISGDSFANWQADVLDPSQDGIVIAYFTAPWCGPCKMLKPRLEELESQVDGLTVVRVDVESNSELAREFRIMSVPTLFFYSEGYQVATTVGAKQKKELVEIIDKYI